MASPVRGLRPVAALRNARLNVPNPTRRTSSLRLSAASMAESTASTTSPALARERSACSATAETSSILFKLYPLWRERPEIGGRTVGSGFPARQRRRHLRPSRHRERAGVCSGGVRLGERGAASKQPPSPRPSAPWGGGDLA